MLTANQIDKQKEKFLEDRENKLKRKVSSAEKKLLSVIIDKLIDKLEVSEGSIRNNNQNINLTQALEKIFDDFNKTTNTAIINSYLKDINQTTSLNNRYFTLFEEDGDKLSSISKRVEATTKRRLGITKKDGLKKGGFLDSFVKDNRLKSQVQQLATSAITGNVSFRQLKQDLSRIVVGDGNEKISGTLQANYRTFIYDTYNQIDNMQAGLYADAIGLQSAFYVGGKIKTTRKFCCQRNGLLFTIDEIKSWRNLKFQGKNPNYDPLLDNGGFNCRHRYRYISNVIAVRRRKDLMINDKGDLVPKPGARKQRLNKC